MHLAIPLALTNLVGFLIGVVALRCAGAPPGCLATSPILYTPSRPFPPACPPCSIAGRLGQFELSAMVLATSVFNVTGLSLLIGFAAAMETFCGQAVSCVCDSVAAAGNVMVRCNNTSTFC